MAKAFVGILFLILSSTSRAQTTPVSDPSQSLNQVDSYLGTQNFETTLACGEKSQFLTPMTSAQLGCDATGSCWGAYQDMATNESAAEVSNCTADGVSIYFENGKIWDISKVDFVSSHGNMGRLFLTQVSNFIGYEGSVNVTGAALAKYTMPSGEALEAMNIQFKFYLGGDVNKSYPCIVSVIKNPKGSAQVVRFRFDTETVFRLKGI